MTMETMLAYLPSQHVLQHWKRVLRFFDNFLLIDLPYQECDRRHSNTSATMRFNIYHVMTWCTLHGRRSLDEENFFRLCLQYTATVSPATIYTRKELVSMETYIYYFNIMFYIPEIQKLAFHLPHVRILGTSHC